MSRVYRGHHRYSDPGHPQIDADKVAYYVKKGLESQFETYSWDQMIDDLDYLTPEEKAWAKQHTTYAVKVS